MNTRIISLTIIGLMAGTILTSCGATSKSNVSSAKQNIKETNQDLKLARIDAQKEIKSDVETDWENFKEKSETAFEEREIFISDFEKALSQARQEEIQKVNLELDNLKRKNDKLKNKLALRTKKFKEKRIRFNESAKEKEQKYEAKFNHDMNELGTTLKDLFKKNV